MFSKKITVLFFSVLLGGNLLAITNIVLDGKSGSVNVSFEIGDITKLVFQDPKHAAIVNAAKPSLLGGGGVDGAIHKAAGPGLLAECQKIKQVSLGVRCPTGEARITGGHNLGSVKIIHTAGPDIRPKLVPNDDEKKLLGNCYRNVLDVAEQNKITQVAFVSISTGIFGYPLKEAVSVAAQVICDYFKDNESLLKTVRFIFLDQDTLDVYAQAFSRVIKSI